MSKTQTFQYTITYHDPKDSDKDKLVSDVTSVQAVDMKHAERIALTTIPAEYKDKLAHLEVTVRAFNAPAPIAKPVFAESNVSSSSISRSYGSTPTTSSKTSFDLIEKRSCQGSPVVNYTVGVNTNCRIGEAVFEVTRESMGLSVYPTQETMAKFDHDTLKKAAEWIFRQASK